VDIESLFIIENAILNENDVEHITERMNGCEDLLQMLRSLQVIAKGDNRQLLRRAILPSKRSNKVSSIKVRLEVLLKSNQPEHVLTTGNFCLALVNERPARLVYHFGYGKVAGYLYMANIDLHKQEMAAGFSSDEEDLKNMDSSNLDVISGQLKSATSPNLAEMTEEEKEAEAEKLMGLLKKLEDTGVVKVISKPSGK
jgi:hypothetical protein